MTAWSKKANSDVILKLVNGFSFMDWCNVA